MVYYHSFYVNFRVRVFHIVAIAYIIQVVICLYGRNIFEKSMLYLSGFNFKKFLTKNVLDFTIFP